MSEAEASTCEECGAPITSDKFGGMCPACLMDFSAGGDGIVTESPSVEQIDLALPEYDVVEEIGKGGMGSVFRAFQPGLNREVAIKVISDSAILEGGFVERFTREAQITAKIDHPSIVPVYEMGYDKDGRGFYTMRLVRGQELGIIFQWADAEKQGWNEPRILAVIGRVCQAVAYAHARGVIHRDLKPANIMVGELGEVYVMDWGLAATSDMEEVRDLRVRLDQGGLDGLTTIATDGCSLVTLEGAVIGTPAYMPPEQARGELENLDHQSDIYSLGAILYSFLAKHPPYMGEGSSTNPYEVLSDVTEKPPDPIRKIDTKASPELVAICEKAMSREKSERYATSQDLAEDLQAYLDGRVVAAHRTGAWQELKKWVVRNRPLAGAIAAAGIIAVSSLGAIALLEKRNSEKLRTSFESEREAKETMSLTLADSYRDLGLGEAENKSFGRASLWFTKAAETSAGDPERVRKNRIRAQLFGERFAPVRIFPHPEGVRYTEENELNFDISSRFLLYQTRDGEYLYDLEAERRFETIDSRNAMVAAFSPVQAGVVALAWRDRVEVRDLMRDRILHTFIWDGELDGEPTCLAWTPAGDGLFIGANRSRLCELKETFDPNAVEFLHDSPPRSAFIDRAGQGIVTICSNGMVRVFDRAGPIGKRSPRFPPQSVKTGRPTQYIFFPSQGRRFSFNRANDWVTLDLKTGNVLSQLRTSHPVALVSPDESHFLSKNGYSRAEDGSVRLETYWYGGAFHPDGSSMLTQRDTTLVDVKTSQILANLPVESHRTVPVGISPDGLLSATATGLIHIWSLAEEQHHSILPAPTHSQPVLSREGRLAAAVGYPVRGKLQERSDVPIYTLPAGKPAAKSLRPMGPTLTGLFSHSGETLVLGSLANSGGCLEFWKWQEGQRYATLELPSLPRALALHPSEPWGALQCDNGEVFRFSLDGSECIPIYEETPPSKDAFRRYGSIQFNSTGDYLVSGALGPAIHIWNVKQDKFQCAPIIFPYVPAGITLRNSRIYVTANAGGSETRRIFDLATGKALESERDFPNSDFTDITNDGKATLACRVGLIPRILDTRTLEPIGPSPVNAGGTDFVGSFLGDSDWLCLAGAQKSKSYIFWIDPRTGRSLAPSRTGIRIIPPLGMAYSARPENRRYLASGDRRIKGIHIFDFSAFLDPPTEELIPEDLLLLAEINAGARFGNAGLITFSPTEWLDRWNRFRSRHPDFHQLAPDSEWLHRHHLTRSLEFGNGNFGASWHARQAEAYRDAASNADTKSD